jgi:hypothetical protein
VRRGRGSDRCDTPRSHRRVTISRGA